MAVRTMSLRTERLVGDIFATDVPACAETLFIIELAISIAPDLDGKRDIDQKAIERLTQLGLGAPSAAIPSAVLLSRANSARTRLVSCLVAVPPADARHHNATVQSS